MSGSRESLNAGKNPHDGSSSRPGAARNLKQLTTTPQTYPLDFSDLTLAATTLAGLGASRGAYDNWISTMVHGLSARGQDLVASSFFEKLKGVHNSTVVHSRVLSHVDVTRWDHCIHAAYTVRSLGDGGRLGLTPYEINALELVMLLHDPHRLGSHALDRVFASMPGAPENFEDWWAKDDYHEYHGAKVVAGDPTIRRLLGKYQADVLSILARDDKRPVAERDQDYGVVEPRLKSQRIEALYRLKDELDRCSYLKLDYIRSGFLEPLIAQVVTDVERHEQTLSAHGAGMQININRASGPRPYDDVARWRHLYRADLATLAIGCLAEKAIFHDGIWDKALERFGPDGLESSNLYTFVRDRALAGEYQDIYSQDAMALLKAAETGSGLSVEDVYAPLVTMTLADVSDVSGRGALENCVPPGLSREICGVPRRDMTRFEAGIRDALEKAGLDSKVHILMSNDFGKVLKYHVSHEGKDPVETVVVSDCQPALIKVIVAARAISESGETINLSATKRVVHEFLRSSGYLKSKDVLNRINPRVFCEPLDETVFSTQVRAKMEAIVPAWIKRGGSGLLD